MLLDKLPHILFICSWYPNPDDLLNGIFIKRHAECVARSYKVTVVFAKSSPSVKKETITVSTTGQLTEIVILYPKIKSSVPLVSSFIKLSSYKKHMRKGIEIAQKKAPISLIHLNTIFPACFSALEAIKELKVPLFITEHWTGYASEDGNYKGFGMRWVTKKIVSKAYTIIVVSEYLKKIMLSHGLNGNFKVVPNVIDTDLFRPEVKADVPNTHFIHISSLNDDQKNVKGIIRAFAAAYQLDSSLRLTIVGESIEKTGLILMAKKLVPENSIVFKGLLAGEELRKEINRNDALVMFSNYETFCVVIPEAFSMGKPVITTAVGGIADYMKPTLGLVVEPKNEKQLTESFITFSSTKSSYNAGLIREFTINHFGEKVVHDELVNLYKTALA